MATIDTIAHRSTGSQIAGKAYFETSTNKFIVFNGSAWIELDSDGTGAVFENRWGASFDGLNDYLDLGTSSSLNPTSTLTISAWVNISGAGTGSIPTIYSSSKSNSGSGGITLTYSNSKFQFYLDTSGSGSWVFAESNSTVNTNQWYHLVGTWDGSTVTLYINGVAQTTTASASTIGYNTNVSAKIGRYDTQYVDGSIDDVSLFDSALSASDISSIYNSGVPADIYSLNPVGWWRMGDHSNDSATAGGNIVTITDSSGNGNDATQSTASRQPTFAQHESLSRVTTKFDTYTEHLEAYPTSDTDIYGLSAFMYFENDVVPTTVQGVAFSVNTDAMLGVGGNITGAVSDELLLVYKGAAFAYTDPSGSIPKGWHHVMLAWSPTSQINPGSPGYDIYLDGVVVGNTTSTQYGSPSLFTIKSNQPLIVGQRGDGNFGMVTKMDDVAIFDSQLSSSDITSIYNNGVPGDISALNPAGWWRMGDDDSLAHDAAISQITDQSGNGLHLVQNAANHYKPTAHHISTIYV